MKWVCLIGMWSLCVHLNIYGQQADPELEVVQEEHLEMLADSEDRDSDDDGEIMQWRQLQKNPVNLNYADAEKLRALPFLHELHIQFLLRYRERFGNFTSIYELQAIPGWYPELIRNLLPYISVNLQADLRMLARGDEAGEHNLLARLSVPLQLAKGYRKQDSTVSDPFFGNPHRMFIRYAYRRGSRIQYGIAAEKDGGERVNFGKGRYGFDYYSAHFFVRNMGKFRALAAGDYTVQLGQGLIHWQGMAFSKSSMITAIKRQGEPLRPYQSAGEFNFHRGLAAVWASALWEITGFISRRRFSANIDADSATSMISSGLHRNQSEWADRQALGVWSGGGRVKRSFRAGHIALNAVAYAFDLPLTKKDYPYNRYAIRDDRWYNLSADYSYTWKNIHVFGELAADRKQYLAFIQGALLSLSHRLDLTLLYRNISPGFQSMFSSAFTEQSRPVNERGIFMGISFRPKREIQLDLFADLFHFPWLRFGADFPSSGSELLVSLRYIPVSGTELSWRWRNHRREQNRPGRTGEMSLNAAALKSSFRAQLLRNVNMYWQYKFRVELVSHGYDHLSSGQGFLAFSEVSHSFRQAPLKLGLRLQYFDTDNYDTRIYAYESDLPYASSIPAFYDRGFRYYLNLRYEMPRNLRSRLSPGSRIRMALKWEQTIHPGIRTTGSGVGEISASTRSAIKGQVLYSF